MTATNPHGISLRVIAPNFHGGGFIAGSTARTWINGQEFSNSINNVIIEADAEGPISATIKFYLSALEGEPPALAEAI